MMKRIFFAVTAAALSGAVQLLTSCDGPPQKSTSSGAQPLPLPDPFISGNELGDWKPLGVEPQSTVKVTDGVMHIKNEEGVNGVRYAGARVIPVADYELSWEGKLVSGGDFFAAATFPVRDLKSCATFINGGWGGNVTGISCIDGLDASENNTTTMVDYKAGQWYRFRVQVTAEMIAAFVDEKQVVRTSIKGRKISLRFGEIEGCAPFGFATYRSAGEVRNVQFRNLKPGELVADKEAF